MINMNRRRFLQTTAATAGAIAASPVLAAEHTLVIDAHLHCFAGKKDLRFPYHARAPYRPEAAATPEHLLKTMRAAGVDRAVVVHPEPYQDDHRYLEHCLNVGRGKLKGTILCFADRPGSTDQLPRLAKRGDIVAARVHAYAPGRMPPFGKPELRALWKLATDHGLALQLHFEPRWCAGFEPLIQEFKETPVLIDHLGRPLQGTPKEWARVVRWADFPNTHIKLSSLKTSSSYPHRDVRPYVAKLLKAYGPARMIYGGGYNATATGESYRGAREFARSFLKHLKPGEQAQVLGGNAAKLMRFV